MQWVFKTVMIATLALMGAACQTHHPKGAIMNTKAGDESKITADGGRLVIVCYDPKPGKDGELRELLRDHVPALRRQGLATERPSYVMRAKNGAYVEVFEWKSQAAIDRAHGDPAVQQMWKAFGEACEYRKLADLAEASDLFAGFTPVDL